jgi:hypothetical protein
MNFNDLLEQLAAHGIGMTAQERSTAQTVRSDNVQPES